MPPNVHSPYRAGPPDPLDVVLDQVLRLAPNIDVRPGSVTRTILEAAASSSEEFQRIREQTARMEAGTRHAQCFWMDQDTYRDIVGPSRLPVYERARAMEHGSASIRAEVDRDIFKALDAAAIYDQARAIQEIQAQEDREIFDRLDAIAAAGTFANDHPTPWRMEEEPGEIVVNPRAIINPRAVERLRGIPLSPTQDDLTQFQGLVGPPFDLASNPTFRLDDIRERRFTSRGIVGQPEPPTPCGEMTLEEIPAKNYA